MSRFLKAGMIVLTATALSPAIAIAADLDPQPIIEHTPAPPVVAAGGFYLRGDIGYSIWNDPDIEFDNQVAGFSSPIDDFSSDNAIVLGGGVGYKFRKYLRIDLTADHRTNKDFEGSTLCGACAGGPIGDRTLGQQTDLDLSTFFANAYFDFGHNKRFKPYIGGGVGFAYLDYGTYISSNNPTINNTTGVTQADLDAANPSREANLLFEGENDIRFAWNLQAGASYDLTKNLAFDGSYRYTRIDGGDIAQTDVGPIVSDDLVGHEIRLGLRYTFGGGHSYEQPSYEEPVFK